MQQPQNRIANVAMETDALSKKRKFNEVSTLPVPVNPKNKVRRLNEEESKQ